MHVILGHFVVTQRSRVWNNFFNIDTSHCGELFSQSTRQKAGRNMGIQRTSGMKDLYSLRRRLVPLSFSKVRNSPLSLSLSPPLCE